MHLFLFLPNGDIDLIAYTVVCFNFDQRWNYYMQLLLLCSHYFLKFLAEMNLMVFINHIPTLKGDNYGEWIKKIDLAFVCGEVDEIITTPKH